MKNLTQGDKSQNKRKIIYVLYSRRRNHHKGINSFSREFDIGTKACHKPGMPRDPHSQAELAILHKKRRPDKGELI